MINAPVRFVADLSRLRRFCWNLAIYFFALILVAIIWRTLRMGDLSLNRDVLPALAFVPAASLALFALLAAISRAYSLDVSQVGLSLNSPFSKPRLLRWDDIASAEPIDVSGIPYLLLRISYRRSGYPIPLWLKDFPRFSSVVEEYAGREHVLSVALRSAIHRCLV